MKDDLSRPDLVGEVRFKVPLVFAIPIGALLVIAIITIGFSRVLLSVPHEAATAIAIVAAANILGACAFIAARRRVARASMVELVLVVLYPVIIGVAIAQFGLAGEESEAAHAEGAAAHAEAPGSGPASTSTALVANGTEWDTDQLAFKPKEKATLEVQNEDPVVHNMSIYPDEAAAMAQEDALFKGPDVDGGAAVTYDIDPLKPGTYTFICDYHTNMVGEVTVE